MVHQRLLLYIAEPTQAILSRLYSKYNKCTRILFLSRKPREINEKELLDFYWNNHILNSEEFDHYKTLGLQDGISETDSGWDPFRGIKIQSLKNSRYRCASFALEDCYKNSYFQYANKIAQISYWALFKSYKCINIIVSDNEISSCQPCLCPTLQLYYDIKEILLKNGILSVGMWNQNQTSRIKRIPSLKAGQVIYYSTVFSRSPTINSIKKKESNSQAIDIVDLTYVRNPGAIWRKLLSGSNKLHLLINADATIWEDLDIDKSRATLIYYRHIIATGVPDPSIMPLVEHSICKNNRMPSDSHSSRIYCRIIEEINNLKSFSRSLGLTINNLTPSLNSSSFDIYSLPAKSTYWFVDIPTPMSMSILSCSFCFSRQRITLLNHSFATLFESYHPAFIRSAVTDKPISGWELGNALGDEEMYVQVKKGCRIASFAYKQNVVEVETIARRYKKIVLVALAGDSHSMQTIEATGGLSNKINIAVFLNSALYNGYIMNDYKSLMSHLSYIQTELRQHSIDAFFNIYCKTIYEGFEDISLLAEHVLLDDSFARSLAIHSPGIGNISHKYWLYNSLSLHIGPGSINDEAALHGCPVFSIDSPYLKLINGSCFDDTKPCSKVTSLSLKELSITSLRQKIESCKATQFKEIVSIV